MSWFTRFLYSAVEEQRKEDHDRGYSWAAGELLRGKTPDAVELAHESSVWDWGPFGYGIVDALHDWKRRMK